MFGVLCVAWQTDGVLTAKLFRLGLKKAIQPVCSHFPLMCTALFLCWGRSHAYFPDREKC